MAPSSLAAGEEPLPQLALPTPATTFSPDRAIVEWEEGTDRGDRADARELAEVTSVRQLGDPSFQLVRVDSDQSMADALATLRDDPSVRVAERDSYSAPNAIPSDPFFDQLWACRTPVSESPASAGPSPAQTSTPWAHGREPWGLRRQ